VEYVFKPNLKSQQTFIYCSIVGIFGVLSLIGADFLKIWYLLSSTKEVMPERLLVILLSAIQLLSPAFNILLIMVSKEMLRSSDYFYIILSITILKAALCVIELCVIYVYKRSLFGQSRETVGEQSDYYY